MAWARNTTAGMHMREPESDTGMGDERLFNKHQGGTETEAGERPETGTDIPGPRAVPRNSMQFLLPRNQSLETRLKILEAAQPAPEFATPEDMCDAANQLIDENPSLSAATKLELRLQNTERRRDMRAFARAGNLDDGEVQRAMHLHNLDMMVYTSEDPEVRSFMKRALKLAVERDKAAARGSTERPVAEPVVDQQVKAAAEHCCRTTGSTVEATACRTLREGCQEHGGRGDGREGNGHVGAATGTGRAQVAQGGPVRRARRGGSPDRQVEQDLGREGWGVRHGGAQPSPQVPGVRKAYLKAQKSKLRARKRAYSRLAAPPDHAPDRL